MHAGFRLTPRPALTRYPRRPNASLLPRWDSLYHMYSTEQFPRYYPLATLDSFYSNSEYEYPSDIVSSLPEVV